MIEKKLEQNLSDYRIFLNNELNSTKKGVFPNHGVEFAAEVLKVMLDNSKSFSAYFASLDGSISNHCNLSSSFQRFIENGYPIKIILDDASPQQSEIYSIFKSFQSERNLEIKITSDKFKRVLNGTHFSYTNDGKFRLETHAQNHEAICSFEGLKMTKALGEVFTTHFTSQKIAALE